MRLEHAAVAAGWPVEGDVDVLAVGGYGAGTGRGGGGRRGRSDHDVPTGAPADHAACLALLAIRDTVWSFQATFVPALLVTDGDPPPYSTTTLPLFAYRGAFEYLRYGYAAAVSVVMFVLTGAVVWLEIRVVARWRRALRWS
ncbi:MAG: hypothetical protein WEA10_04355 [Actinomycetota bacterium]